MSIFVPKRTCGTLHAHTHMYEGAQGNQKYVNWWIYRLYISRAIYFLSFSLLLCKTAYRVSTMSILTIKSPLNWVKLPFIFFSPFSTAAGRNRNKNVRNTIYTRHYIYMLSRNASRNYIFTINTIHAPTY